MKSTTLTPIVKHCAQCGIEFTPANKHRRYCGECYKRKGHPIAIRQCCVCLRDIEVCCAKKQSDCAITKKTYCAECRDLRDQPKSRDVYLCQLCGKEVKSINGKIQGLCSRCKQKEAQKTKRSVCQNCGGPCHFSAKYCTDCYNKFGRGRLEQKPCAICGEMFQPESRNRMYCGKSECSKIGKQRTLDAKYGRKNYYVCLHCGEKYKAKKAEYDTFCTREHYFAWRESNPILGPEPAPDPMPPCEICGYPVIRRNAKTCHSQACKRALYLRQVIANSDRDYSPRPCKECGEVFTPEYGDMRQAYCSTTCSDKRNGRIAKAKRRARLRGATIESVDPFAVFRRDGWHCKLCGVLTPKQLRGTTNAAAPEVDHIVPLSIGGAHSYANTQCLCRKCNQAKGATVAGQLPLL